jgi:hypothetical protein
MIEGLLWVGIQFCGYEAEPGKKKGLALGGLIKEAAERELIDANLQPTR